MPTDIVDFDLPSVGQETLSDDVVFASTFMQEIEAEANGELDSADVGLTIEALEELALMHHPAIGRAEANIVALRGKWQQVGLRPNPVALYNVDEAGDADSAGLHKVTIGQTYVTAGKLGLRQQVVAAEIERARTNLEAERIRVKSGVRAEFQLALVAQERLDMTKQLRDIAKQSVQSVNAMHMASEASRIALLQAQTANAEAELAVETSEASLVAARERLIAVVGVNDLPQARLSGTVGIEIEPVSYEQLRSDVIAASPELAGRVAQIDQAQRSLRLACASVTPDINTQFAAGIDTATDDAFGSLQVSVPLPIINRNQGNIRRTRAEITVADRDLQRAELELKYRLAVAFQKYDVARLQRDRIREEIVPRAEETLELSVQAFEAGESSYLELLTVQRTLFEARLALLNATALASQSANLINNYLLSGVPPTN